MQEKNIILYFTGTNNSLMAAKIIANNLDSCKCIAINEFSTDEHLEAERIGIVCPVYWFGLPNVVRKTMKRIKIDSNAYVFSIITMGSNAGNALSELEQILGANGYSLNYGATVKCPDNYATMLGTQKIANHQSILEEAEKELHRISKDIKGKKKNEIPRFHRIVDMLFTGYRKSLYKKDRKFQVKESCNRCGVCMKLCPVQNIQMEENGPTWQHHCEFCLACISSCPKDAIQIGKKKGGSQKYRNPIIK